MSLALYATWRASPRAQTPALDPQPGGAADVLVPPGRDMVRMIGYWITSFDDRDFIAPQELHGGYPAHVRARIVEYLKGGRLLESYLGLATCRYPSCKHAEFKTGSAAGSSRTVSGRGQRGCFTT